MKSKIKNLTFIVLAIFALALSLGMASAAVLAEWPLTTNAAPINVPGDLTASSFAGVGVSAVAFTANGASASGWPTTGISADDYYQIVLTPNAGKALDIDKLSFTQSRSDTGPTNFIVQWSKSASFASPVTILSGTSETTPNEESITLTGANVIHINSGEILVVRFFAFDANTTAGTWRVKDLKVEGSVAATPNPSMTLTQITPITKTQDGVIRITNNGNTVLSNIQFTDTGNFDVTFTPASIASLAVGSSQDVTVHPVSLGTVGFGGQSVTVTATSGTLSKSLILNVVGTFCRAGPQGGNLSIDSVKIDNNGEGKDDEWQLLDTIEVEVKVENDADVDIDDVFVELGLFDSNGRNQITDLDFINADEEEIDVGSINDGDRETVTFEFRVPADFEDGNYKLAVKAYSDDLGENVECTDSSPDLSDNTFERISVDRESDEGKFIAFNEFVLTPAEATCGERVSFMFSVFNIGDEDQERVKVTLSEPLMGISTSQEITKDLDQGDRETLTMDFAIPQDAEDGFYQLSLVAEYDYNRGSYRESSDDATNYPLRVLGCGAGEGPGPGTPTGRIAAISAVLDSDANAGEELVVRSTITNLRSERAGFVIDASGFESWASLKSVSQNVVELGAGESKEITLRFDVDEDASGEESFVIEVQSGGQSEMREVSVNIGEGAGTGGAGGFNFGDNAYLWIIGIVNVILIILIIVVAVRISRR